LDDFPLDDILYFDGNVNPEQYLELELHLDHPFDIQGFADECKIALATLHLIKYALLWWDSQKRSILPCILAISSWNELKARFRLRWVPSHYVKDLYQKHQSLFQPKMIVENYYRALEVAMTNFYWKYNPSSLLIRLMNSLLIHVPPTSIEVRSSILSIIQMTENRWIDLASI
jgi:hypothetical protein